MLRPEAEHFAHVLPYRASEKAAVSGKRVSTRKSRRNNAEPELGYWRYLRAALNWPLRTGAAAVQYLREISQRRGILLMPFIGFLSGRAMLFGQPCPFGPAFFVLTVLAFPEVALPVFAAVSLGTLSVSRLQFWVWLCGGSLVWYLLRQKPRAFRKFSPALTASFSLATAYGLVSLAQLYVLGQTVTWTWVAAYIILLHITVYLVTPLSSVRELHLGEWLSTDQIVGLLIVSASSFLGIAGIRLGTWNWQIGLSMLAVLVICSQWNTGVAAVSSLCLGALTLGFSTSLPLAMGTFGLIGIGTSIGGRYGKAGTAVGFAASNLLISMSIPDVSALQTWWLHAGAALAAFLLIPYGVIARWAVYLPGAKVMEHRQNSAEARLRREVNTRFMELSGMFSDLAAAFDYFPRGINRQVVDPSCLLDSLSKRVCVGCGRYETCWKDNFYTTSSTLLNLCTLAERTGYLNLTDLGDKLWQDCERRSELVTSANHLLELMQVESRWQKRLRENQEIVAAQLGGVSELLRSFASAVHLNFGFVEECEERVAGEIKRAGLVCQVSVSQTSGGCLIVELDGPACSGRRWCSSYLDGAISTAMGERYSLWQTKCVREATGSGCKMVFLPERRYEVDVQHVRAARPGSLVSGDSFSQIKLKDGKLAFIISDGMGYGTKAALESGTTVKLLKQLLDYGFDREFAVSTVNSILLLRSPDDIFATVDLAIVDLFTGTVEFVKNGAAPSYIMKRGGVVQRIQANSMPLGMLDRVDYYCERACLDGGDTLVMVTDGITDACAGAIEGDEWLLHFLASAERGDPTLAEALLNKVQKAVGGNRDDLTVVTVTLRNAGAGSSTPPGTPEVSVLTRT